MDTEPSGRRHAAAFEALAAQNPWQHTGDVPPALAYAAERGLGVGLWKLLTREGPKRFQLVLGPRRVGKTTAMYQTVRHLLVDAAVPAKRLWWLRLDHPRLISEPLDSLMKWVIELSGATPDSPCFVFLDELTYARDWDLWLKTFYDDRWPVQIVATSSSTAALKDRRLESGVGRWQEQFLPPYSFSEALRLRGSEPHLLVDPDLAKTFFSIHTARFFQPAFPSAAEFDQVRKLFLLTGGFPELLINAFGKEPEEGAAPVADEALRNALLRSQQVLRDDAVERAIYKDIPQVFKVDNPMQLERMLYVLADQVTKVLEPKSLCQTLDGLSQPTFDRYLSYLERSFLVFTLPNYSGSESAVQRRGRKLYFVDTAIRNAALQLGLAPLFNPGEMGVLLENMAASHLFALAQQTQTRLYHWREGNRWEVDLVYDHPDTPACFEIASSGSHGRAGLKAFLERFPRFRGRAFLVYPGAPTVLPGDSPSSDIGTLSLDVFLLGVGAQTAAALAQRLS